MFGILYTYWPHILATLSVILGLTAAIHATMTKQEVRTAIGWVGVIILSPILGAIIYAIFGINRIGKRSSNLAAREMRGINHGLLIDYDVTNQVLGQRFCQLALSMKRLGDSVSRCALTSGNDIRLLNGGDETYDQMFAAIDGAKNSILLEIYIFDRGEIGHKFVQKLAAAVARGVEVRVLIDAVGARYSFPSIVRDLKEAEVPVAVFNGNIIIGLRLPYANLRSHRKILIIDGVMAFTGGMNIRDGFSESIFGKKALKDTHFFMQGPVVSDLFRISAENWTYTTGEDLNSLPWHIKAPALKPNKGTFIRAIPTGPDKTIETNQRMLIGAFTLAQHHILITTPYLLPDRELISALVTAARRGVRVDIVVPGHNNLKLVDCAMRAQYDQLLYDNCHIWSANGVFNHSKLITIDGVWSYVGSSNLDSRSLRLNFEIDLEVFDSQFAEKIKTRIEERIKNSRKIELDALKSRPFIARLIDKVIWLGSPYL